ncbi:MAG: ABC-type dipeptide/oligopeptide/nickel transport system, permease component [Fibrobacteres bacterium]|nr:ABC-type dipeptide/oligopeptide/nickel transport system, permease component [Fibrobacterota bacterium]
MKRSAFYKYLKKPGSYRILAGSIIVGLLALATLTGGAWTSYGPDELDLDHLLTPPSVGWMKRLLATEAGLRMQQRNQAGGRGDSHPRAVTADDEDLDFLQGDSARDGKPAEDSASLGGAAGSPTDAGSGGEGPSAAGAATGGDGGYGQEARHTNKAHLLGTDKNGRDMMALLVAGARNCFLPGLVTCAFALGLGVPLGLFAGYYGGRVRKIVGTFNSTILSLPRLVLILVVICALEPNVYYTMGVLGATLIPRVSELIATRVRILSNMGFILAAKEAALSDFKILYRHLFWYQNRAVFFIQFSLIMAESILVETTLSYLQFGTKPPEVSWGNIIEGSQMSFFSGFYWITFFPAMAIILAILGFFYLGDGLNARLAYREGR